MSLFKTNKMNEHVQPQFLDSIIRGLNYVANCASDMSLQHYEQLVDQFFTISEEGIFKPKVIELQVDEHNVIQFPLIAVTNGKSLFVDEMEIDFSVKVTGIDASEALESMAAAIVNPESEQADPASRFTVAISAASHSNMKRPKDIMDFKVKFKSQDAPEIIMKVVDQFNNMLHPREIEPDGQPAESLPAGE
ncbi:hypothetical protein VA7868_04564 [Vibrio aerogenes CECT 7868]|uniref:DUF2589 domain-containing protein n=1 Tax=Vibrio aerogenes CECT 7868 TaxID=1216006 RepID=A0A1M6F195_9VIBR|nr:DUF2589 domain-containing protein [Vibrio aerogenes]SHI19753.1 hypothetical protein VA7868_02344 [Vibrio aerogenes CECT 7868]SHI91453.1 hypothetical protein VA7868_04564 [Vibrio aerogenes CECT 7868]